ncbi:META domain-containing protein [Erythrobacter sp. BLCC-B19]|uniref:META domain-containing protein n=1 Tax=Erythrobacter sp. BLCC-B19 TaxID=3025315 RepID=UPI002362C68F|nr:META domain-containing protein [Erythrobacter sp. BLCC-B19]WDA39878.1 META domain-containing protein [Erythrobacter sp. BLCC-B19]
MKPVSVLAAAATATLALGGCMTIPDSHPLAGTEWQLTAIDTSGSTTTLTPALQRRHTIAFADGGELQLQLDCNRGRSTWTAGQPANGAGQISIGPIAGTRMACPAPSFGNDLAGLSDAERFTTTLDGRQLVIETPGLRYTFAAAE